MAANAHEYDDTDATLDDFWSSDAGMQACLDRARLAARTDLPILILGESGTGKTILARAIHNSSSRKGRPFIAFNAAALSETLLDSQLFGPERGAVTGATRSVSALDMVGAFDPTTATWYLRNENSAGGADAGVFVYGGVGWRPVVGDWNGDGVTTVGVVDPNGVWYLRNENSAGPPDVAAPFAYGAPGWIPVVGDWNGTGHTGIGMFDPSTGTWYLRNEDSPGPPDAGVFRYGAP